MLTAVAWFALRERFARWLATVVTFTIVGITGYVVYPAAAEAIPRIASLWVQTAVRTLHELVEGR